MLPHLSSLADPVLLLSLQRLFTRIFFALLFPLVEAGEVVLSRFWVECDFFGLIELSSLRCGCHVGLCEFSRKMSSRPTSRFPSEDGSCRSTAGETSRSQLSVEVVGNSFHCFVLQLYNAVTEDRSTASRSNHSTCTEGCITILPPLLRPVSLPNR